MCATVSGINWLQPDLKRFGQSLKSSYFASWTSARREPCLTALAEMGTGQCNEYWYKRCNDVASYEYLNTCRTRAYSQLDTYYYEGKAHLYCAEFAHMLPSVALQGRRSAYRPQQPKPALTDFDLCSYTAARSPSLPLLKVSTFVIHINTWITTHLTTPDRWKAELVLCAVS